MGLPTFLKCLPVTGVAGTTAALGAASLGPAGWVGIGIAAAAVTAVGYYGQKKHDAEAEAIKTFVEQIARQQGDWREGLKAFLERAGIGEEEIRAKAGENPLAQFALLLTGKAGEVKALLAKNQELTLALLRGVDTKIDRLQASMDISAEHQREIKRVVGRLEGEVERSAELLGRVDAQLGDMRSVLESSHELLREVHAEIVRSPQSRADNNLGAAPYTPDDAFYGRDEMLGVLKNKLAPGRAVALTHALSGEGGIGKTAIAYHYAIGAADRYDGRWWLDAAEASLEVSLRQLAEILRGGLPDDADPKRVRAEVGAGLGAGNHLVIVDNLESRESWNGLSGCLAPATTLITTRDRSILPADRMLDVGKLDRAAAVELLTWQQTDLRERPDHAPALEAICEELGDHPLAVKLAAALLRSPLSTPAGLLEALRAQDIGDEGHPFHGLSEAEAGAYGMKVARSLGLSLDRIEGELAVDVLLLVAHLAPEGIGVDLIRDAIEADDGEIERALEQLRVLSLVEVDGGESPSVSIHRITQSLVRVRWREHGAGSARATACGVLLSRLDDMTNHRRWGVHDLALPHAEALLEGAERSGNTTRDEVILAGRVAHGHENRLRREQARAWFERAESGRGALGPEDGELGVILSNFGEFLRSQGDPDGALAKLEEAERIGRAAFGDDHPTVAVRVNNIGSVLQAQGDLAGALARFEEAERIDRAAYGDDHPMVAIRVNNIGSVLQDQEDRAGALAKYQEAERIDRAAFGDDHPSVAICVNNIGRVLHDQGELSGALAKYQEAERINRAAFGDDHPNVAICVNNIGRVLHDQGDRAGALARFEEAERIDRGAYGDDHPMVAIRVNNIGGVLQDQGDLAGAQANYEEAFGILLGAFGPRARDTVVVAGNLQRLDVDPVARARELAGEAVAAALREALRERFGG